MNTRNILIVCVIVFALLIVGLMGLAYFGYLHFTSADSAHPSMPSGLEYPSIVVGSGLLSNRQFITNPPIGAVSDIDVTLRAGKQEIRAAGSGGALTADSSGMVTSSTKFAAAVEGADMVDVNADGFPEYINRGSWYSNPSLMDPKGNCIWTYGGAPGVDDMAAGDINGDGTVEFVVGFNGAGGVHLVDQLGRKLWQRPDGNVWHVEMVDTNDDGRLEIVHSNAAGQMTIRDARGSIIGRSKPVRYFADFSICRWPSKTSRPRALLADDGKIWLFNFDGSVAQQLRAPDCGRFGEISGTTVTLKKGHPECFAVIVGFRDWNRSVLYIYDSNKRLIYDEVISETCRFIRASALGGAKSESLLVGGEGRIWRYDPIK